MISGYPNLTRLSEIFIQKYESYLPTAFDESMSILQKLNKIIQFMNETGILVNSAVDLIEASIESQNIDIVALQKEVTDFSLLTDEKIALFEGRVETELMPNAISTLMDEWAINGKLANLINNAIFNLKKNIPPIVAFTFDDGYVEDNLTYTILKEFGFVGSFGLVTDSVYSSSANTLNNYRQYEKEGFEILSHSATHISMGGASTPFEQQKEFKSSADRLRRMGFSTNGFIAPYSTLSTLNRAYAKEVYDYLLVGGTGLNDTNDYKNKVLTRVSQFSSGVATAKSLIDDAIVNKKLLIFYDHRIGYTGSLTESEFREILTYLKTKTDTNQIEVKNVKDAVIKYYDVEIKDRSISPSKNNLSASNMTGWVLENNTALATVSADTAYKNVVRRVTIPANSLVGTGFEYSTIVKLPTSFSELGEKINGELDVMLSNSQFAYFDTFLDLSFLDSSGNLLLKKSKQFYAENTVFVTNKLELFNQYPVTTTSIDRVKIALRVAVLTVPTVAHFFRVAKPVLSVPTYTQTSGVLKFKNYVDNSVIPDVTGESHILISNTLATSITDFYAEDGSKELTVMFGNANTTIVGTSTGLIRTRDGLSIPTTSGSIITFVRNADVSQAWTEKTRTIRTV